MITIYTTKVCPNCVAAKEYFNKKKLEYVERDAKENVDYIFIKTGKRQVPFIEIDGVRNLLGWDEKTFKELYEASGGTL